jgi:hypothetical protein
MALLPDEPNLDDPKLQDPLPANDDFDRTVYTIIAIVAALLLVSFVIGVPPPMTPPAAVP